MKKKTPAELSMMWARNERRAVVEELASGNDTTFAAIHNAARFAETLDKADRESLLAHVRDAHADEVERTCTPIAFVLDDADARDIIRTACVWSWWGGCFGPDKVVSREHGDNPQHVDWQRGIAMSIAENDGNALAQIALQDGDRCSDACDRLLQRAVFGEIQFG